MAEIDLAREIRRAVDTGRVLFGQKQAEKYLLKDSVALIIVSRNAPGATAEKMAYYADLSGTPLVEYPGTGLELGAVGGKPHPVSGMAVQDTGKSKVLAAAKTAKTTPK